MSDRNFDNLATDISSSPKDNTFQRQWEDIDNHLRQMHVWTDEDNSTSSAGQCNPVPVLSRVQKHQNSHNPLYRRSEGDIQGTSLDRTKINPPQSAPVLPEDYEIDWNTGTTYKDERSIANMENREICDNNQGGISNNALLNCQQIPHKYLPANTYDETWSNICTHLESSLVSDIISPNVKTVSANGLCVDKPILTTENGGDVSIALPVDSFSSTDQQDFLGNSQIIPDNPQLTHQISSPSLLGMLYTSRNVIHANYKDASQTSPPLIVSKTPGSNITTTIDRPTYAASPSARRKSAPIADTSMSCNSRSNVPRRAISHSVKNYNPITTASPAAHSKSVVFSSSSSLSSNIKENDSPAALHNVEPYDDKDYTKALLQHQNERMSRLQAEFHAKEKELIALVANIKAMEAKVIQRNTSYKSPPALPTLQTDVGRLREINRKLEIDCNCMYKEVDLFSRDGDSTRENFYSRYNRPPAVKPNKTRKEVRIQPTSENQRVQPPNELDDEPKWRCSHCTFDNHAALNKCEMCEFPREVQSGRGHLP